MITQDYKCLQWVKNFILNENNRKINIFDVGANTGEFASEIDKIFNNYNIFCFEPNIHAFQNLKKIEKTNIKTFNIGFGAKNDYLYLFEPCSDKNKKGSQLSSLYNRKIFSSWTDVEILKHKVKIETLDDFCNINGINSIDYLKIDVEGHEFEVLKGAKKYLSENKICAGQFEFGSTFDDSGVNIVDIIEYLALFSYSVYFTSIEKQNKLSKNNLFKSIDNWENLIFIRDDVVNKYNSISDEDFWNSI